MLNIILFGAPGSGKGTQADLLVKHYHLNHFSTGDALRDEIEKKSELGLRIESIMAKGELVPDDLVNDLIEKFINSQLKMGSRGIIFDGYPRTIAQAQTLMNSLSAKKIQVWMLDIFVSEDELVKRLLLRGKTKGRADDNYETIQKRIEVYHQTTLPVSRFFADTNNYFAINGNFSIEQTFNQIKNVLDLLQHSR